MMVMKSILGVTVLKISCNGLGIAEGRDLEHESFNLAQMPNRSTKDCLKKYVLVKNSLYICIMKRQIQSYISEEDYSKLKLIAEKEGLLFATLIRQIIINFLKTKNND